MLGSIAPNFWAIKREQLVGVGGRHITLCKYKVAFVLCLKKLRKPDLHTSELGNRKNFFQGVNTLT